MLFNLPIFLTIERLRRKSQSATDFAHELIALFLMPAAFVVGLFVALTGIMLLDVQPLQALSLAAFSAGGLALAGLFALLIIAYIDARGRSIYDTFNRVLPVWHWGEFQEQALRTESRIDEFRFPSQLMFPTLTAFLSVVEMMDVLKKHIYYGKALPTGKDAIALRAVLDDLVHQAIVLRNNFNTITKDGKQPDYVTRNIDPRLAHALIGTATESGELIEALIEAMNGMPVDAVNIAEEFSDIDWYKAIAFDVTGADEPEARGRVIAKLRKRYPHKFNSIDAVFRDLVMEREALEGRSNG